MVLRSSDQPTTVPDSVAANRAAVEELARRQGRGAAALRNSAGHVIDLDTGSQVPMLAPKVTNPDGSDRPMTGMSFTDTGIQVVTAAGGSGSVTAGAVSANGSVTANGDVSAGGNVTAGGAGSFPGGLGSNNGAGINGQLNLTGNLAMGFFEIFCGTIHAQALQCGDVGGANGNWAGNQTAPRFVATVGFFGPGAPSERQLKEETGQLNDPLETIRKLRPAVWKWRNPERFGLENATETVLGGEHVGIYVDELADADPRAVRTNPEGDVGYEDRALMAYLVGAAQQLAQQNDALIAEVGRLRAEINELRKDRT